MKRINTEILFRPSGLGQIMTEPQGKTNLEKYNDAKASLDKAKADLDKCSETAIKTREKLAEKIAKLKKEVPELEKVKDEIQLSKTCRKYIKTMAIEIRYNRRKRLENKYVKKGNEQEAESTELYSEWKGEKLDQNTERIKNDYFTGEIDLRFRDKKGKTVKITDIKTAFDIDTFEDNRDEEAKKEHVLQGLGYCDLTGAKMASVAYCLTNQNFDAINDEIRREAYKYNTGELEGFGAPLWRIIEIVKDSVFDYETFIDFFTKSGVQHMEFVELSKLMEGVYKDQKAQEMFNSFVEVELEDRVIEIEIDCDPEEIARIKKRCDDCRKYMAEKYNIHHVKINPDGTDR